MTVFAGNTPPGQNPVKMKYLTKDIQYLAKHYMVPLQHIAVSSLQIIGALFIKLITVIVVR